MSDIQEFIEFHNSHIIDQALFANIENVSDFAAEKHIALEDLTIEKHRLPFINWCTSLAHS